MIVTVIVIALLAIGILFCVISLGISVNQNKKRNVCTQLVSAVIKDVERVDTVSVDGTRMVSWHPVYEYYANGTTISQRSNIGGPKKRFYPGQTVELYVNPKDVMEYYSPKEKVSVISKIFGGVGLALIVAGVIIKVVL